MTADGSTGNGEIAEADGANIIGRRRVQLLPLPEQSATPAFPLDHIILRHDSLSENLEFHPQGPRLRLPRERSGKPPARELCGRQWFIGVGFGGKGKGQLIGAIVASR